MRGAFSFIEDDLTAPQVVALLELHLAEMHSWSPPCKVHAMSVERLRQPDVTFWSAWQGEQLAACGALRHLSADHGEIKSMRAHPEWRGKGAGRAMLLHLLDQARARGYFRLSLETGASGEFEPARRLYASGGFQTCGPFGDYLEDPFSQFMTRTL